jgi:hypothetical protein
VHRAQITFNALDTDTDELKRGRIDATSAAVERWAERTWRDACATIPRSSSGVYAHLLPRSDVLAPETVAAIPGDKAVANAAA